MVGVRTSKGCSLCLKRSIKCDEARPSCFNCRKGGRHCPGYARDLKFIDQGPGLRKKKPKHRRLPGHDPGNLPEHGALIDRTVYSGKDNNGVKNEEILNEHLLDDLQRSLDYNKHPSSWRLNCQQLIYCFTSAMFPLGTESAQMSFLGSWLWHVPPRLGKGDGNGCLDHAALSMALAYFASTSRDPGMLHQAEVAYTLALRNLSRSIADPQRQFGSEVLCATLLLGHYESLAGVDRAWIRHAGGAARLMQLRGARRCYESPFEYAMFLSCRGAIIEEAIATGQQCFLDGPDWRSIPSSLIQFPLLPRDAEMHHSIFNHFASVSGLRQKALEVTKLPADGDTSLDLKARLTLLSEARTLRLRFQHWFDSYITLDDGLRRPCFHLAAPLSEHSYPFSSFYSYLDTMSSTLIVAYYAYLILVNRTIQLLEGDNPCSDTDLEPENMRLALAISMSWEYLSQSGYCGQQALRFALPIALGSMPKAYHEWVRKCIAGSQSRPRT